MSTPKTVMVSLPENTNLRQPIHHKGPLTIRGLCIRDDQAEWTDLSKHAPNTGDHVPKWVNHSPSKKAGVKYISADGSWMIRDAGSQADDWRLCSDEDVDRICSNGTAPNLYVDGDLETKILYGKKWTLGGGYVSGCIVNQCRVPIFQHFPTIFFQRQKNPS